MHARNRSPGNGYMPNSIGRGGVAAASRVAPEGSFRGPGLYNIDYGSYSRGVGHVRMRSFQTSQSQPHRDGDIFMEAGRLATEYLVSKGLLPPDIISGKWQTNSLKNGGNDLRSFRMQEGDRLHLPQEGRPSALSRLGNAVPDLGSGRSKFSNDGKLCLRNYERGSRRMESLKNGGLEWNQELQRSRFPSENPSSLIVKEGNNGALSCCHEEQQVLEEIGSRSHKSSPSQSAPKIDSLSSASQLTTIIDNADSLKLDLDKNQIDNDADLKMNSTAEKDSPVRAELVTIRRPADPLILETENGGSKNIFNSDKVEQSTSMDVSMQDLQQNTDPSSKNGCDLLSLCKFTKVPTKTRSSLTARASKICLFTVTKNEDVQENGPSEESEVLIKDVSAGPSSRADALANQSQPLDCLPDNLNVSAKEDAETFDLTYVAGERRCASSLSLQEISPLNEEETPREEPGYVRSSSMPIALERGEKRTVEVNVAWEVSKKPRELTPSSDVQANDYSNFSNIKEKQPNSWDGRSLAGEEGNSSLFPGVASKPRIEYSQKKQPYLGSFKICDLNLVEASEMNENHNSHPVPFSPIQDSKKETVPVDIDLSINNTNNTADPYTACETGGKVVEVIDLENDSIEHNSFNNSERKVETVFAGLENFPDHTHNANAIPDVQENYGFMISELLGNDISNCSSMPPDINPLHNDMGLHNGEEILGDDDSIYMSLGEIPIGFMRVWEQPMREYEKPF